MILRSASLPETEPRDAEPILRTRKRRWFVQHRSNEKSAAGSGLRTATRGHRGCERSRRSGSLCAGAGGDVGRRGGLAGIAAFSSTGRRGRKMKPGGRGRRRRRRAFFFILGHFDNVGIGRDALHQVNGSGTTSDPLDIRVKKLIAKLSQVDEQSARRSVQSILAPEHERDIAILLHEHIQPWLTRSVIHHHPSCNLIETKREH
mmetsp:Transcript_21040/g.38493  ORF Transcript_21040/g.38493 Transcript_21040/m.38493 type:complete len:204 (+) Transcript_21040:830-1441(+)